MANVTRRDLSIVLAALGSVATGLADEASQTHQPSPLGHSRVFSFDELPVSYSSGGAATRPVMKGKLPTGESIEMHETTLAPQQMPHPAHRHIHTEFMLVREGRLEFQLDGHSEQLGPGGVAYAASGELHGLKNVGGIPANYFVIAIGTEPNAPKR